MFRQLSRFVVQPRRIPFSSSIQQRFASTLVLGELSGADDVSDSTKSAILASSKIDDNSIDVLLCGTNLSTPATAAASLSGVSKVLLVEDDTLSNPTAENVTNILSNLVSSSSYTHIIAGVSTFSRDVLPRLAGVLDTSQISDVIEILSPNSYIRPIYAGNAICKVSSKDELQLLTVRPTSFSARDLETQDKAAEVVNLDKGTFEKFNGKEWVSDEVSQASGPTLTSASIVVSGGRALKSEDNFKLMYGLAKVLPDAAVGASRAAVDAGYAGNDLQVGQTGKVVAPNLYIACGISGAIQHVAGMKDSKTIVAINTDEEASIFTIADYGLKADLFEAVPKLTEMVESNAEN